MHEGSLAENDDRVYPSANHMPKRLSPKDFKAIYRKVPRACVDLVVKTPQGIVLTMRQIEPEKGKWHLPGGTILKGESLSQAVQRVAKAELGVSVKIEKLLGAIEYLHLKKYFSQPLSFAFLVTPKKMNFTLDHQASEVQIFKSLPKNIFPSQGRFLKQNSEWTNPGI